MYSQYQGTIPQLDEAAATGLLQHLSIAELQQLCDDDDKLSCLIMDLPQVKNLEVQKQTQLASNKSIAEYNLSKEPGLTQGKTQLAQTYEQGVSIQKEFDKNKEKFDYLVSQQNLDTVLALLQTEAAKAEEESEELSNSFLEGDQQLDSFVDTYVQQRTTTHLRRVKAEKMMEILQQARTGNAGNRGSFHGQQNTANNWGGAAPSAAPYPTGPYGAMPTLPYGHR